VLLPAVATVAANVRNVVASRRQKRCLTDAESGIAQSYAIYGKVNCRHASVKQFSEQTLIGVAALCITALPKQPRHGHTWT
jgi:hypothetical protein